MVRRFNSGYGNMLVFHHLGGSVTMYTVRSVLVHITDSATNYTVFVASINGDGALGPESSAIFIYGQ